ncbi:hypothetical protein CTEN210_13699 [Chaetoceros tenuissimus]|uniref:Leucine-rich repeat domain-containing protein n=1 Tax=Chaetoceros tenuissimus TaxID=426638 RepID=A0AAD3D3T1_9STRA|nr:hypothetical protein CTEN210_13699 [Chaetoceros tenuissimus]
MRVATVDGLVTLFYDGSKPLFNHELLCEWLDKKFELDQEEGRYRTEDEIGDDWQNWDLSLECKRYWKERLSWQQVIVEDGITHIAERTFWYCCNIKRVIFSNTVIRIEGSAFGCCMKLEFIEWPLNLQFIGGSAFKCCDLSSVFIPPRCREIKNWAFQGCRELIILNIPQDTELGNVNIVCHETKIMDRSPYTEFNAREFNEWNKNINNGDEFALHRVCSSFEPTLEMILDTMKEKGGPKAFR